MSYLFLAPNPGPLNLVPYFLTSSWILTARDFSLYLPGGMSYSPLRTDNSENAFSKIGKTWILIHLRLLLYYKQKLWHKRIIKIANYFNVYTEQIDTFIR